MKLDRHSLYGARHLLAKSEGRDEHSLSWRELARRTAVELGDPAREAALQVALSRARRGKNVWLGPPELGALAAVLGLRSGVDVTEPRRWVFREVFDERHSIRWIGDRLPVFTSVVAAYEAKGWVTLHDGTVPRELESVSPAVVFYTELAAELEARGGEGLMLLDPPAAAFRELAGVPAVAA